MKTGVWNKAREFYYYAGDFDALMRAVQMRRFSVPYAVGAIKQNPDFTESEIRRYEAMYGLFRTYEQYNNLKNMLVYLNNTVKLINKLCPQIINIKLSRFSWV